MAELMKIKNALIQEIHTEANLMFTRFFYTLKFEGEAPELLKEIPFNRTVDIVLVGKEL